MENFVVEGIGETNARVDVCEDGELPVEPGETRRIPCRPNTKGKFVKIKLAGNNAAHLSICEVEVYGVYGWFTTITIVFTSIC